MASSPAVPAVVFNDVILQASDPNLPLGGVGASVMGAYHGQTGFETFSHRRRLLGGFYAFESYTDTSRLGTLCSARTDAAGRLSCEGKPPASGNLILRARAVDGAGRPSIGHREVWIAGGEPWWFGVQDSDRMDVLPEAPRYEPGQTARFQVRMPFRSATVLVTHEL